MAAKRKRTYTESVKRRTSAGEEPSFTFTSGQVKWVVGILGGLLALFLAWDQVWQKIEAHWRLEAVQAAKDKQLDTQMKSIEDKAANDSKQIARRAEIGRAWLFYNLSDFRADNTQQWAQVCTALKQPPEVCQKWQADAAQLRQEAADAKRQANEAGKGMP